MLKRCIKALCFKIGRLFIDEQRLYSLVKRAIVETKSHQLHNLEGAVQSLLKQVYTLQKQIPSFDDVQYRCYSQNGEDGILNFLFSKVGTTNKKVLEICAGDGMECNATNLIVHHGWDALLFDGNPENVKRGKAFFSSTKETMLCPPTFEQAWLTPNNVNDLVKSRGFEGEIDLLSIDVDGVDYWLWKSLTVVQPRVVVIEYNQVWTAEETMTVPNDPNFKGQFFGYMSDYGGASLSALAELGKKLGYRLVGAERQNFNAFFIRKDVAPDLFPEVAVRDCLSSPLIQKTRTERRKNIVDKPWVDVSR